MLKASGGGGGRGMKIVRDEAELSAPSTARPRRSRASRTPTSTSSASSRPPHIEFQVVADQHGNVVCVGERECSIQRRHQKLLEESSRAALRPAHSARLMDVRIERAVRETGYRSLGTLEFLVDERASSTSWR
jgi:acetyl-CoA carboxylase biotin carboxylase subunit